MLTFHLRRVEHVNEEVLVLVLVVDRLVVEVVDGILKENYQPAALSGRKPSR